MTSFDALPSVRLREIDLADGAELTEKALPVVIRGADVKFYEKSGLKGARPYFCTSGTGLEETIALKL